MTWLAPSFLAAGGLAALVVVALHLIALQRPRRYLLPTARFVPAAAARAAAITRRPSDWLLLALRALALVALGAAFARPVLTPQRLAIRQLLVVDRSDAVADVAALRDSVLAHFAPGDAVIVLDSVARPLVAPDADSLRALTLSDAPASMSAGLVAARRMATTLADSSDSLRIVFISPFAAESFDAAVPAVRSGWPGALQLVSLAARDDSAVSAPLLPPEAAGDDPLVAGVHGAALATSHPVRLLRRAATAADSAWAREGGMLLAWPESRPDGWHDRAAPDSVGALVAGMATVVAPFGRPWTAPDPAAGDRVAARWVDGEPAALERPLGAGCVRTVGVPLDRRGDLTLRPAFGALLRALTAPCGGERDVVPLATSQLQTLRGSGATAVPVADLRRPDERSALTPWLLGLALLLLVVEWALRGRLDGRMSADATDDQVGANPSAGTSNRSRGVA